MEKITRQGRRKVVVQPNFFNFDAIKLTIASPEQIRSWSYGEVKKAETINYRTFKPERDGLFCERIFGPVRDWECNCGRYKFVRHRGVVCDRCGVEVTESHVRRERMGHIELGVPVAHIWFLKKPPSRIGMFLEMLLIDLERVIYYLNYIALEEIVLNSEDKKNLEKRIEELSTIPNNEKLVSELNEGVLLAGKILPKQLFSIDAAGEMKKILNERFKADIGAPAIRKLLEKIDLKEEATKVKKRLASVKAETERSRLIRRLRLIEGFINSNTRPEWMILTVLPVIPPDLRPLVQLESGKFATSDLNDLYRRIINRNNRLKIVQSHCAPQVMINNEKRLLQEAVDALIENAGRDNPVLGAGNRPLKSFSEIIKGKQGRFRQNLLGKRVDYSGRSVIVVGPELKLHQCGIPKEMALELFKPFVLHELLKKPDMTVKNAKRMIEKHNPEIWAILEEVIKGHPVLLNRAPSLHRMSIQAFEPVLIEGKAIQLHPLTCAAYNADFDGDQVAVHVVLSPEAQLEAKLLMLSSKNILSPANGKPIITATQDIVLGCNYLTQEKLGVKGEGRIFSCVKEVIFAYSTGKVDIHARIKVADINSIKEEGLKDEEQNNVLKWKNYTTVGRILFNEIVPPEFGFINKPVGKKELTDLIEQCYHKLGCYRTAVFLDQLKEIGYKYATLSGLTVSISDMKIPKIKNELIDNAQREIKGIELQARQGVITQTERYNKIIDIWTQLSDKLADIMFDEMKKDEELPYTPDKPRFNSIYMMAHSGARGGPLQVRQLAGMRGLMTRPQRKITGQVGEIIETPVISNFHEGLTVLEYFISTHGARKGLADTALKTADAGYLTRKLIDVTHNIVITEKDCGTINGVRVEALQSGEEMIESLEERIVGRVALDNVVGLLPVSPGEYKEELIIKEGEIITLEAVRKVVIAGIERIRIRSILTCEAKDGICATCYGINLATGQLPELGEAVGIIAAQSIGEPGTQLTLRTFHIGGTASRVIRESQIVASRTGTVKYHNVKEVRNDKGEIMVITRNAEVSVIDASGKQRDVYKLSYGTKLMVEENANVRKGDIIAEWDPYALPIITEFDGKVKYEDIIEGKTMHKEKSRATGLVEKIISAYRAERLRPQLGIYDKLGKRLAVYPLPIDTILCVEDHQQVSRGTILAKIPQEVIKTKDITGGLPRIVELFEARAPKNAAVISEIDGVVKLGTTPAGFPMVTIYNEQSKMSREYILPQGRHLVVYEGDRVGAGEPLTDGAINPHDILKVKGAKETQEFLVGEIQQVYRLQGVNINDKHIEIVVRQMFSNVRVVNPGDSMFLRGEIVPKKQFDQEVNRLKGAKKKLRRSEASKIKMPEIQPVLLGTTKTALSSQSFISAASFQETTRVLTEAASQGQVDYLRGLKENVIIGQLIPAGTGFQKNLIPVEVRS